MATRPKTLTAAHRRQKSKERPPQMSNLRIVLLGSSVSENSLVGNFILGRAAFDSEAPPDVVERVRGRLKNRHVIIISSPQLLQKNISAHQITQTVRECVFLSDPGPHVIVLLLSHDQCSAEDQERVEKVLDSFSESVYQHTMVLSTQEPTETSDVLQKIIQRCADRHFSLQRSSSPDDLLQMLERTEKVNDGRYLHCAEASHCIATEPQNEERLSESVKLNLIVCGSDNTLKSSVSDLIRQQTQRRSDVDLHGHRINLLEFPALIGLSEEEVMRQTLCCVSLCHPGVHVFLLIVPVCLLTDEDKAEIEKIQRTFDCRENFMVLFTSDFSVEGPVTDFVKSSSDSQILISLCGGRYCLMGLKEPENSRQIPDLLDYIENMKTEPYSLQMYMNTQENRVRHELEEKHKKELSEKENEIKDLKQKIQSEGAEGEADDQKCLRIVLFGKTGNGKSSTGNTILGRNEFHCQLSLDSVTTVCQKGVGETNGRSVAVVDTPGIFDTTLPKQQVIEEIVKCISMSSPGPHVFVIVLTVGRFTKEEFDTMQLIEKVFGHEAARFSIILFTRGDDLQDETIEGYVKRSNNPDLKKLIRDCGDRFLVFNNRVKQDKSQVVQLLNMIEELKNSNQGQYFTNSMFEEAEMSIKKRKEGILKEREKEIQAEREDLQAKYEMEMKDMMKKLQKEKRKADEKRKQRENEFRQKQEKLLKDLEEKHRKEKQKQESEHQDQLEKQKLENTKYDRKSEEMKREIENQRLQYEKQQKEREEEDKRRQEKYRQDQITMKNEQDSIIAQLLTKQDEETKRRYLERKRRDEEEEEERQRWKRKLKEAENDRKEIQEEIKQQQREWEDEKKRQMRERDKEERERKERHKEQLREKQDELEKMRKRFEREREEERQKIEEDRQKQRKEREEKEREYRDKTAEIKRKYEQLKQEREKEWERRKQEDDEKQEEERKKWKQMIEDLKQEQEEEIKRKEAEEKEKKERQEEERDKMKQKHEKEIKVLKKKHEDQARKQAEEFNESTERKLQHVLELTEIIKQQYELIEKLQQHLKKQNREEIEQLQKQAEQLKNRNCVIL